VEKQEVVIGGNGVNVESNLWWRETHQQRAHVSVRLAVWCLGW